MVDLSTYGFMEKKNHVYTRLLWFLIYGLLLGATVALVLSLWGAFLVNPTVTTLESAYFPVSKIPFPGVAFCEINKISRKRAESYAKFLAEHSNLNETETMEAMHLFGNLYDFEYSKRDVEIIYKVQAALDDLDTDLILLLKELSVKCPDLLRHCSWKGANINCSQIFQTRLTYNGFCCIFNYVKRITHFTREFTLEEPYKGQEGISEGLSVLIEQDSDDYFYAPLSSRGLTIQIFEPGDFPDQPSGSLSEVIATTNTETFLEVIPTTVVAVKELMKYSPDKRGCIFNEERPTKFGDVYSQSDCNVDCRVDSIQGLCQCVPFMIPLSTKDNVCRLTDLQCLNRHKNKWNFLYPGDNIDHLRKEKHDSLRCSEMCYPSCDGTSYQVSIDSAPFHKLLSKSHSHQAAIHVFYAKRFSNLYKHDVVYYWFEILSNFGGTFGLVIGMSLVSLVECSLFWMNFLRRKFMN